jgi:hypothetical protein
MRVLIKPRSAARLAVLSTLVVALAPATAHATTTPGRHAPAYDLCDGHKWSLFGCRPGPGRHGSPSVG